MIYPITNSHVAKIPGIYHDQSEETREMAGQLLQFFLENGVGPSKPFVFSIFRDSMVSLFLQNGGDLADIVRSKAPFLNDHPEQMEILLTIAERDLQATLSQGRGQ